MMKKLKRENGNCCIKTILLLLTHLLKIVSIREGFDGALLLCQCNTCFRRLHPYCIPGHWSDSAGKIPGATWQIFGSQLGPQLHII